MHIRRHYVSGIHHFHPRTGKLKIGTLLIYRYHLFHPWTGARTGEHTTRHQRDLLIEIERGEINAQERGTIVAATALARCCMGVLFFFCWFVSGVCPRLALCSHLAGVWDPHQRTRQTSRGTRMYKGTLSLRRVEVTHSWVLT